MTAPPRRPEPPAPTASAAPTANRAHTHAAHRDPSRPPPRSRSWTKPGTLGPGCAVTPGWFPGLKGKGRSATIGAEAFTRGSWQLAPGRPGRHPGRGPGPQRYGRRPHGRARPVRRGARRAGEPVPASGRAAWRGLDRERLAALSVARIRLRPAHRPAA